MNRWGLLLLTGIVIVLAGQDSIAQRASISLDLATELWHEGNFEGAYSLLSRYRDKEFGRSFDVDYMLGTSACQIPDHRERGALFLGWVLYAYGDKLTQEGRDTVAAEIRRCQSIIENGNGNDARKSPPRDNIIPAAGVRALGKSYFWIDPRRQILDDYRHVRAQSISIFDGYPIPLGDRTTASDFQDRFYRGFKTRVFSRFIISTKSGHTDEQLRRLNSLLERFSDFFSREYKIQSLSYFIHVYLLPSSEELSDFARNGNRLNLARFTIAYSSPSNLSMAAVIPSTKFGSLYHELFHLLVKSNFGDNPTWIDEGIAALYEESIPNSNGFMGAPNWRGPILKRYSDLIPSLKDLIEQNLLARDVPQSTRDVTYQAVLAATARYFALYLQDTGRLSDLYAALRDFGSFESATGFQDNLLKVVEESAGQPIESLDADFRQWLARVN